MSKTWLGMTLFPTETKASVEGLQNSTPTSALININTPEYVDAIDALHKTSQASLEAIGMCNTIKAPEQNTLPPILYSHSKPDTLHILILQSVMSPNQAANLLCAIERASPECTIILSVATWLNDDTWLSLASALSRCAAKTVFRVDFLYNAAALLVLATVQEIDLGPWSYFILDSPADRTVGGTIGDVNTVVENYLRIQELVTKYAVEANMFTADEIKAVYEEKAIYGLFGDELTKRLITNRKALIR